MTIEQVKEYPYTLTITKEFSDELKPYLKAESMAIDISTLYNEVFRPLFKHAELPKAEYELLQDTWEKIEEHFEGSWDTDIDSCP
tara:strand:+ start:1007 stop:1261 length:255 start_codon:yes stop_codon:yes gene_type:complete